MSMAYLAQPDQQPTVEWLAGGTFAVLLDAAATKGQLGVGRFRVSQGEAPPYHQHLREDEVFMLISGTALLWCDDEEMELSEGGIVFLPRNVSHSYRITSPTADLLMMCTPGGFEGMFLQAGKPITSPRQSHSEPERDAMVKAADDFGQVVVGPPR
jgi:quercetin dioxygenase-like cupin family protein